MSTIDHSAAFRVADDAAATHKRIRMLNKELTKARNANQRADVEARIKAEKDDWWTRNKHEFAR